MWYVAFKNKYRSRISIKHDLKVVSELACSGSQLQTNHGMSVTPQGKIAVVGIGVDDGLTAKAMYRPKSCTCLPFQRVIMKL
jgi:hypothetical protein